MELLIFVLVVVALSLTVFGLIYSRLTRQGKNPWPWSIGAFLLCAIGLFAIVVMFLIATISC